MRSILASGIALTFLLGAVSCKNDPVQVNALTKKDTLPLLTTQNVDLLVSDSAKLKVHLTAPREEDYAGEDQRSVFRQGLHIDFFDSVGNVNSSMEAMYGERRPKKQETIVKQKVVVVNVNGDKLETEKLIWDERGQKIHTDAFVKITTRTQVLMGNGMTADADFTNYEITKPTGTIWLNENEE
jgi:LPS export ABC transporter protein LptC